MGFKAGTIEQFENSMAAAIEAAFERAWNKVKDIDLPEEGRRDRRILFVAVAQGVITYLKEHADTGFDVVASGVQQEGNRIESSGTASFSGTGDVSISVTQDAETDNRVVVDIAPEDAEIIINTEGLDS